LKLGKEQTELGLDDALVHSESHSNAKSARVISKSDLTVVLPVLNEEKAIRPVLSELLEQGYHNILVIDGYSHDLTPEVASELGVEVVQQHGRAKTGSIETAARLVQTPYFLVMDGDYTYDPKDIEKFLIHGANYDEIIGRRTAEGDVISTSHQFGNRFITSLFNLLLSAKLSDVCSGMYLLNTESARKLDMTSNGFNLEVEIAAQMSYDGRVTEVPINYRERIGKRKLSTWRDGLKIISSVFRLGLHYNPVFLFSLLAGLATIPGIILVSSSTLDWLGGNPQIVPLVLGMGLSLFGGQSLLIGGISLLLKRSERRISAHVRSLAFPLSRAPFDE
jgi:dolichol-phosphate hexosyltransferase